MLFHLQSATSQETLNELFTTLYVGESRFGFYAMPALVDEKTVTIAPRYTGPPLLEGPTPIAVHVIQFPCINNFCMNLLRTNKMRLLSLQAKNPDEFLHSSRPIAYVDLDAAAKASHNPEEGILILGWFQML